MELEERYSSRQNTNRNPGEEITSGRDGSKCAYVASPVQLKTEPDLFEAENSAVK